MIIEAIKYDGTNLQEIKEFTGDRIEYLSMENGEIRKEQSKGKLLLINNGPCYGVSKGDYIIKEPIGIYSSLRSDVFEDLYEPMEDE